MVVEVPLLLVRPFLVDALPQARSAIRAASRGDVAPLQALYVQAHDALQDLDPDEIREHVVAHRDAGALDKAALRAATEVFDGWEGIVAV